MLEIDKGIVYDAEFRASPGRNLPIGTYHVKNREDIPPNATNIKNIGDGEIIDGPYQVDGKWYVNYHTHDPHQIVRYEGNLWPGRGGGYLTSGSREVPAPV